MEPPCLAPPGNKNQYMLQYITNTDCKVPVADQVRAVLDGGCRWIQVRMKDASDEEVSKVVETIKPWCMEKEAFLILNDRVELARKLDVGGVHIGKDDMPPRQARGLLGPAAVIGVTVNTFDDIRALAGMDIDYLGMGPYAGTSTKKNLAPILGVNGIRDLCLDMVKADMAFAHVAVGGITLADVEPLMEAGVNGIAVSGAIAFAHDLTKATKDFINALKPFQ